MEILNINKFVEKYGIDEIDGKEFYVFNYVPNRNNLFKNVSVNLLPIKVTINKPFNYYNDDVYVRTVKTDRNISIYSSSSSISEEEKYICVAKDRDSAIEQYTYLINEALELKRKVLEEEENKVEKILDNLETKVL